MPSGECVTALAFSHRGPVLAVAETGNAFLWNIHTVRRLWTLTDQGGMGGTPVAFSHDDEMLATGDSNGQVYLWRVATGEFIGSLSEPGSVTSVAFSPDRMTLAVGDVSDNTYRWRWRGF